MFFDEPYLHLPKDAQYYFNVLIVCIAVSPEYAQEIFDSNITDIWDIQNVTEGRPIAVHIYITHHINKDFDYSLVKSNNINFIIATQLVDSLAQTFE